ncbi:MAG: c-type cytochrome [Desulfovibrio sp.]|jgi:quinol-cytochrome oxidoreductase complex cytochrome b subunit|nr:c-type cytochrome [Desulfovibrio sp.]
MTTADKTSGNGHSGHPFYPDHLLVEGIVAVIVLLAILLVSQVWQVPLEEMASPSDTSYVPRPEWYFLFYFQLLKYFHGPLIVVGTFVLPLLLFAALVLLPFLDRKPARGVLQRPRSLTAGVLAIAAMILLTVVAYQEDDSMKLPPVTDQQVAAGKDIFYRFCILCHKMDGQGGFMAPDLTHIGSRSGRTYMERVIINPKIVSPSSIMSIVPLSDAERHEVSAYLSRKK